MKRLSWVLSLLLAVSFVVLATPGARADPPAVGTRIADRSFAAVHRVRDTWQVTATVPVLGLNESALNTLAQTQIRQRVQSGAIPNTKAAIQEALVDAIAAAPTTYLVPKSETRSVETELTGHGSGWTITPDGYLVTAAHVVHKTDKALAKGVQDKALEQILKEDMAAIAQSNYPWTQGQLKKLGTAMLAVYAANMSLGDPRHSVSVRLEESGEDGAKEGRFVEAEVIDKGEGFPGSDWALLKMKDVEDLPTIPMGDESEMVAGGPMHLIGYPGTSDLVIGEAEDANNTPTITEGTVTSIKTNEEGVPLFQTQAPASGGNSGGPAFNENGEVVGVLVAATVDPESGAQVPGQGWVIQGSEVKKALEKNSIKPSESKLSKVYNEGLDLFYKNHFSAALEKFKEAKELYPKHPYVETFIERSNKAIKEGRDETPEEPKTPEGLPMWLWITIGGAAVVVVGLVVFGLVRSRRKAAAQLPDAAGWASGVQQSPVPQPSAQPQQGGWQTNQPPQGQWSPVNQQPPNQGGWPQQQGWPQQGNQPNPQGQQPGNWQQYPNNRPQQPQWPQQGQGNWPQQGQGGW